MARRVIDLSQPLGRETQLHPFFPSVQILRQIVHSDAPPGRPSFSAEVIVTSNHAATHVDAFAHYDPSPDAPRIAEMPLDTFCGEAICVDLREYPRGHGVTAAELEQALAAGGLDVRDGDILLFCTDHYNRTAGTPAFLDGFSGIDAKRRSLDGRPRREDLRRRDDQPRSRLPHGRVSGPPRLRRAPADPLREPQRPERGREP